MTVLYRSLFTSSPEDPADYVAQARGLYMAWATETSDGAEHADGTIQVTLNRTRRIDRQEQHFDLERSVSLRTLNDADTVCGFEGTTRETSEEMTWTTVVRVAVADEVAHVWVENQVESERLVGVRLSVGRPRIVDDLLGVTPNARLGGSRVQVEPVSIPSDGVPILVEHLRSGHRTLPMIVVSQPNSEDNGAWQMRAQRIARRVSGVATVATVDRDAVAKFSSELGQLATWDGSIRVYAPVPVVDGEGYRHRYTLRALLEDPATERSQIDRIVYGVCSLSARRRPDPAFDIFLSASIRRRSFGGEGLGILGGGGTAVPGEGVDDPPVCPAFPLRFLVVPAGGVGQLAAAAGGSSAA